MGTIIRKDIPLCFLSACGAENTLFSTFIRAILRHPLLAESALCVRWVVQRDEGGLAQPLLFSDNQAAVLQLPEDSRGALTAAVEFGLRLFQGEVQPNRAVRLDVAVLPGDAGSIQQQRIEHLRVVADVPQGFVLEKEPRERHIGRRWALRREFAKSFHLNQPFGRVASAQIGMKECRQAVAFLVE